MAVYLPLATGQSEVGKLNRSPSFHARSRGYALVLVLWSIALMLVIGERFAAQVRTELLLTRNQVTEVQAGALADAGIALAIHELTMPRNERRWRADGGVYSVSVPGGDVELRLWAENGKLDLNAVPITLIENLMAELQIGETPAHRQRLAAAISDWRDSDDRTDTGGSESTVYREHGLAHTPKNAVFSSVGELIMVAGLDRTMVATLAPMVTVHNQRVAIDPKTASKSALSALPGISSAEVSAYLAARRLRAQNNRPEPDYPLELSTTGNFLAPSVAEVFTVQALGHSTNGGTVTKRAIVKLGGESSTPYVIVDWIERAVSAVPETRDAAPIL